MQLINELRFVDLGLIPYQEGLRRQLLVHEEVTQKKSPETVIFCTHSPVVTLGRGTQASDIFGWQGEMVEVSRGGRATYHGPNQVIAYPILDLQKENHKFSVKDLRGYTEALEKSVIATLKVFEMQGEVRKTKTDIHGPSLTGVWCQDKKIASIGFAVRKWVTYHGLALNVLEDPKAFQGINPCGFESKVMGSIESMTGVRIEPAQVQSVLADELRKNI